VTEPHGGRTLVLISIALGSTLYGAIPLARAQSGVQITPDRRLALVSKDVGDQRWAIAWDAATGVATGNVFFPDGGEPAFVWCERTDGGGEGAATLRFSCFGADRCDASPCTAESWSLIAEVDLPASFLAPPAAPREVPTEDAALFAYLQAGRYRDFAAESGVHPSAGPHGNGVRSFVNAVLDRSLAEGNLSHPVGAAAVKELYDGGAALTGWAVEVKVADGAGGDGWYWYEVFSTTDGSRPISGVGNPICTGCHAEGIDFVRIPYPLQ
jgi:hypothetical protein